MKVIGVLLITLSAISPASSVFTIVPGIVGSAGTGAVLAMAAAAVIGLFMAFVYAELGSAYPLSGGEYAIIGRVLGPFAGFVVLGNVVVSSALIPAVFALGITDYLAVLHPGLPTVPTAIATVLLAGAVVCLNIRANAAVTGLFLCVEILTLVILTVLGFSHPSRPLSELFLSPVMPGNGVLLATPLIAIGLATTVAVFSYNGYGSAIYFSEEMHEADRHIGRTILWALVITVLTELVPLVAVLAGTSDLQALLSSPAGIFSAFLAERASAGFGQVVSLGVALAIFNAIIAILLTQARILFSTGRDACWAGGLNRGLATIHARFNSPWIATVVASVLSAAACLLDIQVLLVITGTGLILIYAMLCVAVMVGRRNGTLTQARYRMPFFPLPPIAALLATAFIVYASWLDPQIGRPSILVTVGISVLSAGYYLFVLRRRGAWVLQGPEG